jgi:uncharacterized protein (TIGR00645 family)
MNKVAATSQWIADWIEWAIFESRWLLLAPMSLGLLAAGLLYEWRFFIDIYHMFTGVEKETEMVMLAILGLVDQYMVANLLYTVYAGSWLIFVRTPAAAGGPKINKRPRVLDKINSGTLKIKMSTSLIGITGVHLLKDFVNAEHQSWELLSKRMAVHGIFLVSSIALSIVDRMVLHPAGHDDNDKTPETTEQKEAH